MTRTDDRGLADPDRGWRRSSYSAYQGNCVEIAQLAGGRIGIRDSKNPDTGTLAVTPAAFAAFLAAVRSGNFG